MNSNVDENKSSITSDVEVNIVSDIEHTNSLTDIQNPTTVVLSSETHEKILNYLMNELTTLKESNNEKDSYIQILNDKVYELTKNLEDLETKLNKKDNLGLLLKLKENLTIKQHIISDEINHEIEYNNTKKTETIELNFNIEDKKPNIIIEDDSSSLKPKKKPAVFRRGF
jgi:hypothetical protein